MIGKMKAAFLMKPGHIEITEVDIPTPDEDQVLIRVKAVGLCGSDVHYYQHGKIGPYVVERPIILGHESAGEIVAVGSKVDHLHTGQRVSVEPGVTCGRCDHCKSGHYNLCKKVNFLATPPYDGAFCEYIAIRADVVFPIPDHMSYEEAAMVEPFSVGLHAVRRGDLLPGETVAIMGMGPIGLMTALAAKSAGAKKIIGVDLEEFRLATAIKMGVTDVIHLKHEDLSSALDRITNGKGVDLAIETAGNSNAVQSALGAVRRGGRLVIVGLPPEDQTPMSVLQLVDNEIDIRGVFRYRNTYPTGIDILSSQEVDLSPMITDRMPLDETAVAFEKAITNKSNTLKIIINP